MAQFLAVITTLEEGHPAHPIAPGGPPPVAGWTPPGYRPSHPIYPGTPPGIWGPTDPRPTNPIVLPPLPAPPDMIWPILPGHPIVLPPDPPVGIWPMPPPYPAHPIAPGGLPPYASHQPVPPPSGGTTPPPGGGSPPVVDNALPPVPGVPTLPIYLPPPGEPAAPGDPGCVVIWVPGVGYVIVPVGAQLPESPAQPKA